MDLCSFSSKRGFFHGLFPPKNRHSRSFLVSGSLVGGTNNQKPIIPGFGFLLLVMELGNWGLEPKAHPGSFLGQIR